MNTQILTNFETVFDNVDDKKDLKTYPVHHHGFINYYEIDDVDLSTEKLLQTYDEHSDTLGIG